MENTLKQKLAAGARPIGTFFDTASVSLMECLGRTGLDFAIIDNEHSPIEAETTAALVRASELSGICPLARVREISRPAVLKLLDVGVQGLIVPNVKTLAQVQELVNYAKYYPIGQRGFCPSRKDGWGFDGLGSVPETMRHFNGETLLFPQCETAEALAIIEDICAVDGVDGIFVGPFDLSISMGMPGQFDAPEFQAAVTRIVAACRAAGKYCMFFTGTADGVIDGFRRGFDAMAYSLDAALFIQSVKRDVENIRSRLQRDSIRHTAQKQTRLCQCRDGFLASQRRRRRRRCSRKHIGDLFNVRFTDELRRILDLVQPLLRIADIDKIHAVRKHAHDRAISPILEQHAVVFLASHDFCAQRLNARRRRRRPRRSTSRDRAANRSSHNRPPCPAPSAPGPDAGVPT